jgi:DNA helicase-2/ATP-dependent DNA helicase PcrA
VERWKVIAERAAEVLLDYEQKAGRPAFGPALNAAATIEDIAQRCFGLEVMDSAWLEDGVLGELNLEGKKISVRPGLEPDRRAFTVAHDIGHAALNHSPRIVDLEEHIDEQVGLDELEAQDGVYQSYNSRDRLEIEANLFAAELLTPTRFLLQATQEDPAWTVEGLAEKFGVSETAMLTQLANVLLMHCDAPVPEERGTQEGGADDSGSPVLNEDQEDAVNAPTPALVIAGPGAGKTRVLAERYAWLSRSGKPEDSILALTFSNKAAEEMRVRVAGMLGGGYEEIQAYTFHGFCLELLKSYGHLVGLPESFTLLTEMDASLLVRRRLHELGLSHLENLSDPGFYVPGLLDAISRAKDELRSPADFARLANECASTAEEETESAGKTVEAAKVYAAYQDWLKEKDYVDYGDLVRLVIEVLEGHPGAAQEIRDRYGHILVDEFQDINFAMGRLLRALDGGRGVVWAVADPDQSIYRFRGASPANLERFGADYPGFRTIRLSKNYRSGPDIVGSCHGLRSPLASEGEGSKEPPLLRATRPASEMPAVSLVVAPDRDAELDYLAEEVRSRKERGVPLGDQAVLCSSNAQARRIVARLAAAGLAAQGPTSLLGSEEIKDALAVVSLLRENDGTSLLRVAAFEENCLSEREVVKLLTWAREQGRSVKEALACCDEVEDLSEEAIECLVEFGRFLDNLPGWGDPWHAVLTYAFHPESRLRQIFSDPSDRARRRLLQLGQLAVLARSFGEREGLVEDDGTLGFLEYVRELAASNKGSGTLYAPAVQNAVHVMTVHKSKGLEFPVVYVPHLARGQFPVRNPGGGKVPLPPGLLHNSELEDREEEDRCLFYVALTRAEDELVLSRAEVYGRRAGALPLIDRLVREASGRVMVEEKRWEKAPNGLEDPAVEETPGANGTGSRTVYSYREIERYDKCSLQYRYAEIVGLPEKRSAYQEFHNSVYRVLGEMEMEAKSTGQNPDLEWSRELLKRVWEEEGPLDHFYESVYHQHAERAVENWQSAEAALEWQVREKLSLSAPEETQIEVMADAIRRGDDGSIIIARHRFGRPRKSHKEGEHNQDRHALYMAAARETWPEISVRVELHYLTSGEVVDATPTGTIIRNRTGKFRTHVHKARAGSYPANPGQECKSCPWNLVCPSSV